MRSCKLKVFLQDFIIIFEELLDCSLVLVSCSISVYLVLAEHDARDYDPLVEFVKLDKAVNLDKQLDRFMSAKTSLTMIKGLRSAV